MRIISGKFRGKKLQSPVGGDTRPTSDRTRQALFNVLEHRYDLKYKDLRVLDAFAGTGALGIEALSRGAAFCTFAEKSPPMLDVLKANLQSFPNQFEILKGDVLHQSAQHLLAGSAHPYGLMFLDPPYHQGLVELALEKLHASHALSETTLIVAEMAKDEAVPPSLKVLSEHIYGGTKVLMGRV
jgi:16S rRNA (guanine966-N2)-methyltransferase